MRLRLLIALVSVVVGAALLSSPASAADITGSDAAGDVKAKGLTAAERAALDVVSVRVVGEAGLGVVVTATFRGNFEQRVGRGHLKTALAALVLVPKPGAGLPAGVVTVGTGPVGTVLERTASETVGAVRDGRTVTFFVGGPGFENVESVEVRTLAKAPGLGGRGVAGIVDIPEVPDKAWQAILDRPSETAKVTIDPSRLSCDELRRLRAELSANLLLVTPLPGHVDHLLPLLDAVANELRSERCSYPFLFGYHFTGTPLALLFYDGGMPVGRIAVMLMYNTDGIVPDSYAGVVTSGRDAVVQASSVEELTGSIVPVDDNPRPGTSAPAPDLSRLPVDLPLPEGVQEIERTLLRDPPTQTGFIFFHNDTTGVDKLVSNPELSSTQLIPGTTALQLSQDVFELFPVDPNGQTSVTTREELPQPPLTPHLDQAVALVQAALADEKNAIEANTIRVMNKRAAEAAASLKKALQAVADAVTAGELGAVGHAEIGNRLRDARDWDETVPLHLESTNLSAEERKRRARDDLARGIELKNVALGLLHAAKETLQAGK